MPLTDKQRGVRRGALVALLLSATGIFVSPFIPGLPRPEADLAARIGFALRWDLLLALCLIANVGAVANHRFRTPEDIDGSGLTVGTARVKTLQAVLQNTLEQVVIAAIVHLSWAATMPVAWQASLAIATLLFATGRVVFVRGYERGAPGRAAGFGLTFYPSALMVVALVVHTLLGLFGA